MSLPLSASVSQKLKWRMSTRRVPGSIEQRRSTGSFCTFVSASARRLPLLLTFAIVTVVDVERKVFLNSWESFGEVLGTGFPAIYVESYRRS